MADTPDASPLTPAEAAAFTQSVLNVERAIASQLASHPDRTFPITFIAQLHRNLDQVMLTQGQEAACTPGCSHCCHARVEVSPPEAFRIARALQAWQQDALSALIERLHSHVAADSEIDNWNARPACPFLSEHRCTIYEVRPGACRRAHSLDARLCETGASQIPQDLGKLVAAEALLMGVQAAYQAHGLEMTAQSLAKRVLLALTEAGLEARWCSGE
jgi:hypothetical protein